MMPKSLYGIGAVVIITVICMGTQVSPDQIERGGQWLSWSVNERDAYVEGFISGYLKARLIACNSADQLFEVGQPHRLGDEQHPTEIPSGRCLASMDTYSKYKYADFAFDNSAYTKVVTEFYTTHPEYTGVPFPSLMELLSDKKYKTADQLYQMALKGELRPVR